MTNPEPAEIVITDTSVALHALQDERIRQKISSLELEAISGVTPSAFYSYLEGKIKSPGLANIIALAESLGFEIVMRRKDGADSRNLSAIPNVD